MLAARFLLTILAGLAWFGPAIGADIRLAVRDPARPELGTLQMVVSGPIEAGDTGRFTALLDEANRQGRKVLSISSDSPGGNLSEGLRLAAAIRNARLVAVVPAGGTCASACFITFAAGQGKVVYQPARIGVHGASVNGRETDEAAAGTIAMAREVARLGVPPAIIGKMAVTPGSDMVWLSPDDLRSMRGEFGDVLLR